MRLLDFLREVKVELQNVVWPSKRQTIQLTMIVVLVSIIVGFFIGGLDLLLTQLFKALLKL